MSRFEFNEVKFGDVIDEARPLLERHWNEIARNKDLISLDPDYERYAMLDEAGKLCVCIARENGTLVGYACYIVDYHLHYKSTLWAVSDIFWLAPECRKAGVGMRLFKFVESVLHDRGVIVMHTTFKVAHPAAGRLLEAMGHATIEGGCSKVIGGG